MARVSLAASLLAAQAASADLPRVPWRCCACGVAVAADAVEWEDVPPGWQVGGRCPLCGPALLERAPLSAPLIPPSAKPGIRFSGSSNLSKLGQAPQGRVRPLGQTSWGACGQSDAPRRGCPQPRVVGRSGCPHAGARSASLLACGMGKLKPRSVDKASSLVHRIAGERRSRRALFLRRPACRPGYWGALAFACAAAAVLVLTGCGELVDRRDARFCDAADMARTSARCGVYR